jgi:hypothetical protein
MAGLGAMGLVALVVAGCAGSYTTSAANVTDTSATVNGIVFDPYDATITYWFQYGKTTSYGSETTHRSLVISDRDNHPVSESLTGLTQGTTYHYQVCAKDPNPHGQDPGNAVVCGGDRTFTTTGATQLAISAQPALYPDFDPAVSDYVTRCAGNPVTMSVTAPAGTTVAIAGGSARSGQFTQSVALSSGKSFTFATTAAGQTSTFHVRCLPSDFPDWTYTKPGTPSAHFYITTPQNVLTPSGQTASRYVAIFDDDGVPVWWDNANGTDGLIQPDGTIGWWTPTAGGTSTAGFETHNLNGSLVHTWRTVGTPADIHDFQRLSNGNALIGAYPPRPGTMDLSAYGGPATGGTLLDGEIQEIKPDGTKVWSWNTDGHIDPSETPSYWRTAFVYAFPQQTSDGRNAYDWAHMNSFQQVGNTVVVSFRHLDAVYAIDKSTGDIIWKLGGTHTDKSLTVVGDPESDPLGGQHYARVLSDGTLTIHDNNTDSGTRPRAIRYQLNLFNRTATLIDSVTDPDASPSPCCGSAQHLADGSWLMSWGGTPLITEFGPTGNRHFELTFKQGTSNGFSYRVDPITGSSPTIGDLRAGMDAMP